MKLSWRIEQADIDRVKSFVKERESDPFVLNRAEKCLADTHPDITKDVFWLAMVSCLLTTRQSSGPDSKVNQFICANPFQLGYETCRVQEALKQFAERVLSSFGGIRRSKMISEELTENMTKLEGGLWAQVSVQLALLHGDHDAATERTVAHFMDEHLKGFGPKQSRNILQSLGLTRYEIPIDSRITKWLNDFGFPVTLSASALQDANYYDFVSDGIQELCRLSKVYPCVLDAAIFSSFDKGKWKAGNIIW